MGGGDEEEEKKEKEEWNIKGRKVPENRSNFFDQKRDNFNIGEKQCTGSYFSC